MPIMIEDIALALLSFTGVLVFKAGLDLADTGYLITGMAVILTGVIGIIGRRK